MFPKRRMPPKFIEMHSGSLKADLEGFWGEDPIQKMRAWEEEWYEYTEEDIRIKAQAYAWRKVDQAILDCLSKDWFLKETIVCDDYIAYKTQHGEEEVALLAVADSQANWWSGDYDFQPDPKEAYSLRKEWELVVDRVELVGVRIDFDIDSKSGKSRVIFGRYFYDGRYGRDYIRVLRPVRIGEKYRMEECTTEFWGTLPVRMYDTLVMGKKKEYEKLFAEDVEIKINKNEAHGEKGEELVAKGIDEAETFFSRQAVSLAHVSPKSGYHSGELLLFIGNWQAEPFVNVANQIQEVLLKKKSRGEPVARVWLPEAASIAEPIPELCSVRGLNVSETYAYAIQATFANGVIKNYCLKAIETAEIPAQIEIDGKRFDQAMLHTVRCVRNFMKNGVMFANKFFIPKDLLYCRGTAPLMPQQFGDIVYENESFRVRRLYRIPFGTEITVNGDRYVPKYALLDAEGNRISDFSAFAMKKLDEGDTYWVRSDFSYKEGYLNADGTWAVPPIFDSLERMEKGSCAKASIGEQHFLVNRAFEIIPFEHEIHTERFCHDLCPFGAEEYEGEICRPEPERLVYLRPGSWGYVDSMGKEIVSPQYIFADSFGFGYVYAVVARMIDGEVRWGAIDTKGKEIIPCQYTNIEPCNEHAMAVQTEENGNYGLIDLEGNILMEPKFRYVENVDEACRYAVVRNEEYKAGVYSIAEKKLIVPLEYYEVYLDDDYIECDDPEALFDYQGAPYVVPAPPIQESKPEQAPPKPLPALFCFLGYNDVRYQGEFIIPQMKNPRGYPILDAIYDADKKPVVGEIGRNTTIEGNVIHRDTPKGTVYYRTEPKSSRN